MWQRASKRVLGQGAAVVWGWTGVAVSSMVRKAFGPLKILDMRRSVLSDEIGSKETWMVFLPRLFPAKGGPGPIDHLTIFETVLKRRENA